MPHRTSETRIYLTVPLLFGLQVGYFLCISLVFSLPVARLCVFTAVSAVYHALFFLGLRRVRREFNFEQTGKPLQGLNLPLLLSFLRLSAVPAVVFLFLSIRRLSLALVVAPFLVAVFLTDLLDGLLARALHQETRLGRIADAAGDYLLIFTVTILFGVYGLLPWWVGGLVLFRLSLQSAGVVTLYRRKGYSSLKLTFLGKASIFATFCLYGFELAEHLRVPIVGSPALLSVLEYLTAGVIAASIADKVLFLGREFRALRLEPHRDSGRQSPGD